MATHEKHQVVAGGKIGDVGHAIGYLTADGVEATEDGIGRDVLLDVLDDAMKLAQILRGLGIEIDVAAEVELADILEVGHHNGMVGGLAHQPQHLGMARFPEYHYLSLAAVFPL